MSRVAGWAAGRRIRAYAGQVGLLAVLGLVAALLLTAAPRLANHHADQALRADLVRLPHQARDLSVTVDQRPERVGTAAAGLADLDPIAEALPSPLPDLIGQRWYGAWLAPETMTADGDVAPMNGGAAKQVGLRAQTGVEEAATLTSGRWPATRPGQPVELAVSQRTARTLSLAPGTRLRLTGSGGGARADATVVGVFTPRDAADPVWDDLASALDPIVPATDGDPYVTIAVTDWTGLDSVAVRTATQARYGWRYRVDETRLDASQLTQVSAAVAQARRTQWRPDAVVQTSLDFAVDRFGAQLRAVRALLAVVQAGLVASVVGLILLAAGLAVRRRGAELALLRARGASLPAIGVRTLAETVPVQPLAVLAGWLAGTAVPGRGGGGTWPLLGLVALTTAVVPVLAMVGQRRVGVVAGRTDLTRSRPSARRLTAEASVLALAVAGVVLLRRRGLAPVDGVDVYLTSVPVLVAVAAALVALRVLPWPLRLLDRAARRVRGAVLFLGVTRAGRGAPVTLGPLAVLIVAVSTGVFGGVVTTTVGAARDRASDLVVPGDAWLTGYAFPTDAGPDLARVPGVTAVARVRLESNRRVLAGTGAAARLVGQARVMVVDVPAFTQVARRSGVDVDVPAALRAAARGDGPVPAVVSPAVARSLAGGGAADVQGRVYAFTVAAVAATFPGLGTDSERFVVLPWQALPEHADTPIVANRYLVAGDVTDATRLLSTADEAQCRHQGAVLGVPVEQPELPAAVQTRRAYRAELDRTGANSVLTLAFTAGAAGGAALAVLAVGFAVVADAAGRGRVLSRLRTMGLSARQGRRLLVYELVPLVVVAAGAGAAVGVALPRLLGDTLGLSAFTPGAAVRDHLDPRVVAGVLALVVVGLVAGLAVENLVNRRMRLGEVLRVGEENS
ncbi:putative ABC transport system permease protein [Micromonospora nigra]|uniref:Putative ABC transport system permease protein n=1 Tax=Micromonospora nigra TaxID=145857 RepID=A0A1C6T3S6_9ACTN|nr:FtsX-like permease family protein [Micromonospora nigra]SCL36357.1 putative ABC transport system permease protein [Micromonospora nigra]